MKNGFSYFFLICVWLIGSVGWAYRSGQGTQADPYEIADVNDLLELAQTPGDYSSSVSYTHLTLPTKRIV